MGFSGGQSGISGASDVALSNPANAHLLSYNATTSKWSNRTVPQTKSDLALGNVDNTSDADKPVSTAVQAALNLKASTSATVTLAGSQTITGTKTFSSVPVVPDNSFGIDKISGLETTLANKIATPVTWVSGTAYQVGDYVQVTNHVFRTEIANSGTVAPTSANSEPEVDGANFRYYGGSSSIASSWMRRATDGSVTATRMYATAAPVAPTELISKSYLEDELEAITTVSRPATTIPVMWNTGTSTWQYKGVTVTALPSGYLSGDSIVFIGHPTPGTMPAWAPDNSYAVAAGS